MRQNSEWQNSESQKSECQKSESQNSECDIWATATKERVPKEQVPKRQEKQRPPLLSYSSSLQSVDGPKIFIWKSYINTSKFITSAGSLQEGQDEPHGSQFPCGMLWRRTVDGVPRTNNKLEGFHHGIQGMFDGVHPTMAKFLKGLHGEHALQYGTYMQALAGAEPPAQKKVYESINKRLKALILQHEGGHVTNSEFLRGLSHNLNLNVWKITIQKFVCNFAAYYFLSLALLALAHMSHSPFLHLLFWHSLFCRSGSYVALAVLGLALLGLAVLSLAVLFRHRLKRLQRVVRGWLQKKCLTVTELTNL